jgi:CheY-like chemotaxis protein
MCQILLTIFHGIQSEPDFMLDLAPILLAEGNADDVLLVRRAFEKAHIPNPVVVVQNGQEAVEYLGRTGHYKDPLCSPWPCLMLLASKLPLMDAAEVLTWWKRHKHSTELPIIVMTSSASPSKIDELMQLGAADYRFKPRDLDGLIDLAQELRFGWLQRQATGA